MFDLEDRDRKEKLVYAYKILSFLGLDDHTYTHLSIRSQDPNYFYIYPFGLRFEEVCLDSLLKVSISGEIIEGEEYQYNKTGYMIHGTIYSKRSDINAIFHIHTSATVAVSVMELGLLPISQWALHFYRRVSYHAYGSLILDEKQGSNLIQDLKDNYVMFLRHHGAMMSGRTIEEAMFYTHHLEQACKAQCSILSMNMPYLEIPEDICTQAVNDLLSFEERLGDRDWKAWVRKINSFKNT